MKIQLVIIASIAILFLSCAHQVSPGGGPDDRSGPRVVSTVPEQAALNVRPDGGMAFVFSEWIAPAAAQKSVSILPPLDGGAKIRVSGRKLRIVPAKPLAPAMTYHVVVTAACTDLRGNQLASPYSLVFSTGPTLDSGKLSGCVTDPARPRFQPVVALFRGEADSVLLGTPDYLTQTDSAAFFSFEHIHCGDFRAVAFLDQNGNRRLDPAEAAYAPAMRRVTVGGAGGAIMLFPADCDTTRPRLASVRALSPKIIACRLSRPFDTGLGFAGLLWTVEALDKKAKNPAVAQCVWTDRRRTGCALLLGDTLSLLSYRLLCRYQRPHNGAVSMAGDTARFNGVMERDTSPPALLSCSPSSGPVPLIPEIRLSFSKPVTLTAKLWLADSLRDTVPLAADPGYCDTVRLLPGRSLHPGSRYRLVLLKGSGRDIAGNVLRPRDTTDTVGTPFFSALAPDDIAVSLRGCAPCLGADKERKWQFLPFGGAPAAVSRDSGGCFRFDSLPAAKGFLGYFTDANGNGVPDRGSLVPWRAPEAFLVLPDTVEARARWEIEGLTVPACRACGPGEAAAPAKTQEAGDLIRSGR